MREDGNKLGPLALRIMAASHVAVLRGSADEIASLMQAAQRPIPVLPIDPIQREAVLTACCRSREIESAVY